MISCAHVFSLPSVTLSLPNYGRRCITRDICWSR
jgi:hypothetical protein